MDRLLKQQVPDLSKAGQFFPSQPLCQFNMQAAATASERGYTQ
jgi:hypothetical protein